MPSDDPIKTAKESLALVVDVMKAAGDNPTVKEAGQNLGQTVLTITRTINTVLLPLAALNFAVEKARKYFAGPFHDELSQKVINIPPEHLIEPKAYLAGPALQALAFSHDEPDLKAMYLNLLSNAMDDRTSADSHPAFVEFIKQLNAEEAALLNGLLAKDSAVPICEVRLQVLPGPGWHVLLTHMLRVTDTTNPKKAIQLPRLAAMVDNWVRLGLVEVDYGKIISGNDVYLWAEDRPEVIALRLLHDKPTSKVTIQRGLLVKTALGAQFAKAVGINSPAPSSPPPAGHA